MQRVKIMSSRTQDPNHWFREDGAGGLLDARNREKLRQINNDEDGVQEEGLVPDVGGGWSPRYGDVGSGGWLLRQLEEQRRSGDASPANIKSLLISHWFGGLFC